MIKGITEYLANLLTIFRSKPQVMKSKNEDVSENVDLKYKKKYVNKDIESEIEFRLKGRVSEGIIVDVMKVIKGKADDPK